MTAPPTVRVGMRFAARDADLLATLAARVKSGEAAGDAQTFESAELAARTGEPMIVYCTHPSEAMAMAAMYVRLGCRMPTLDDLTGHRPAR